VSLSKISSQGVVIDRTRRLVSRSLSNDIHISLQISARGSVSQGGRSVAVGPGIVTLCETDRPFTLNYAEPSQRHIVLQIARVALGVDDSTISVLAGRQIGQSSPARDAYVSFVSSLMAERRLVPETVLNDMAGVVTSLAAAVVRTELAYASVLPDRGGALFVTMLDYVRANLTSPLLVPDLIARAHHVSRRRLYELCELVGETPSHFIREQRL